MTRYTRLIIPGVLSLSLLLLGVGGIYGGTIFLADPSGGLMGMPVSYLDGLPIHDYLLPGLWLLAVMGICPLVILYGLWARPIWHWTAALEQRSHAHWAWTTGVVLSTILLIQLCVELLLGMVAPPTILTGLLGLLILACLLMPVVRMRYAEGTAGSARSMREGASR